MTNGGGGGSPCGRGDSPAGEGSVLSVTPFSWLEILVVEAILCVSF